MKIYHLFFLVLFLKGVVGPDLAGSQHECQFRLSGFCYPEHLPCPDCFAPYGYCEFELRCCAKIWWLPECEHATSPAESFFPKATTPSQKLFDKTKKPK